MSPLARIPSIKLKLGLVIVLAIVVTAASMLVAAKLGLRLRWGAVVAVGISLVVVWFVARGMTSPLRAMARGAGAIARGDHAQRIETASRDEVGQLARAFNAMAADLDDLDRARRDFVADAAHELRTPISALRASLENAVDGVEEADLPALLAQAERLGRMADQLLDLSALEGGTGALRPRRFAVAELARDCPAEVDIPHDLHVVGDPDRLRQVVTNLVDNAHRHGAAPVTLRATPATGGVRLVVEDRGPGLSADDAQRVFDRFARTDRSRSVAGAGLGLSIARSIVELHGGAIRAEPAVPTGCRMVVDLP